MMNDDDDDDDIPAFSPAKLVLDLATPQGCKTYSWLVTYGTEMVYPLSGTLRSAIEYMGGLHLPFYIDRW